VLLAAAVILLSSAPMEIADSGVNTLWYLGLAMFWAVLWRPRTRAGIAVAAVVSFLVTSSTIIVFLYAPLLAIRLFVLRRPREHAVTAGWLAGCLLQVSFVVRAALADQSRLVGAGARPSAGTTGGATRSPFTCTTWYSGGPAGTCRGGWSRTPP
jgi:hypothetical protein